MKLVIINAIQEFDPIIKQILKQAQVHTFSYRSVIGYRDSSDDALENNWFASEMHETESVLFYAFVPSEQVDPLFELVTSFNQSQTTISQIHLAVLNIEKSN